MTPDELASFVSKHESSRRRDELLYALGLRFMRAGRYPEARQAFERVRTIADSYDLTSRNYRWSSDDGSTPHPKFNIRHEFWDEYGEGDGEYINKSDAGHGSKRDTRVYADWLMRDLQTLDELERLQAAIDRAADDETKAEAMYQLASYFYQGKMLFYNPAAWRGMRADLLKSLDETNYRSPNEGERIWRYVQEHDAAARALSAYLDVVRLFPRTRAAADSLYTAVHCHNRLWTYNGYWSARYEEGLHAGARMVTLADVQRAYPRYRLPRADGKWEPSTRTVSGKPAWPTPPPPKQLTDTERARLKIKTVERRAFKAWELFGEIAGGRAKKWTLVTLRWSLIAFVGALMAIVFRVTRRSRAVLYELVSRVIEQRRSSPTPQIMPAQSSSYGAHEPYTFGGRLRTLSGEMWTGLWQVILDERGRAALALNFVTHGVLTLLLYALFWVARVG
jgi:hypothetical protein